MPTLDRLAPWTTTGVGSLPFRDPAAAAAHSLLAYGLPFCPQLPLLDGDMITEWLGADPKRCGWSTERDRERPRAWEAFLAELRRHPPRDRLVKLQVTGPATLACALERHDGGRPSRRQALALAEQLASWLAANVSSQVRHLAALGFSSVLVIDEPALAVFGAGEIERAWEPLRTLAPAWGLHLCCHVPWDTITRAKPDLLSFDLALDQVGAQAAAVLGRHLDRGGWVAWGAIRVERSEHGTHGVKRLVAALARIDADPSRSLLTGSCGSGRMSEGREREIAVGLFDLAAAMRERDRSAHPPSGEHGESDTAGTSSRAPH
jgi:hypothetical protein